MIKWYDHCEDGEPTEIYSCPRLMLMQDYNIIPLDNVAYAVHIIPRFDKENQFLVNRHLF